MQKAYLICGVEARGPTYFISAELIAGKLRMSIVTPLTFRGCAKQCVTCIVIYLYLQAHCFIAGHSRLCKLIYTVIILYRNMLNHV